MAYNRTTWQDSPSTSTPVNATRLNNVEQGLVDAHNFIVICTSTTRPASPFAGQVIYETDTVKLLVWNGSAWADVYPTAVPTGVISPFGGATAPTGYLLCDGSSQSTTTYAALFAVIAYTYGGSSGSFTLPDLRGRAPVGAGTESPANAANAVARTRGTKFGDTRLQSHTHTGSSTTGYMNSNWNHGHDHQGPGGHSHGVWFGDVGGLVTFSFGPDAVWNGSYGSQGDTTTGTDTNHTHGFSFTSNDHNQGVGTSANAPPSVGVNFIIKT